MVTTSNQRAAGPNTEANAAPVRSVQAGCHERLGHVVARHLQNPCRRPAAQHTQAAFDAIRPLVEGGGKPLIFDAFCGTGMSTALLAQRYPGHLVIGIDKSARRLGRHGNTPGDSYLLVRADCGDFWRLAAAAGWRLAHHFLLYPNPWPKPGQLKRRVHGSPDLAALLALGGHVELRSNWQIYVEEFGSALCLAGHFAHVGRVFPRTALSLHERKYQRSGHALWRCRCQLGDNTPPHTAAKQVR